MASSWPVDLLVIRKKVCWSSPHTGASNWKLPFLILKVDSKWPLDTSEASEWLLMSLHTYFSSTIAAWAI